MGNVLVWLRCALVCTWTITQWLTGTDGRWQTVCSVYINIYCYYLFYFLLQNSTYCENKYLQYNCILISLKLRQSV